MIEHSRADVLIGVDASRALAPRLTGTERYARAVISALLDQGSRHRFRMYFREDPSAWSARHAAVEMVWIRQRRLWTHLGLWRELRRAPPEALFIPAHVVPFGVRLLPRPVRVVVTVHDVGYRHFPRAHPAQQWLYLELSTRLSVRLADAVLVDSDATRRDVLRFYRPAPEKVRVAYPGALPIAEASPGEVQARLERLGVEPKRYIVHVGTLHPRKNLERLVQAWAQAGLTGMQLVLVGGVGWGKTHRLCQRAGVRCLGYVGDDEKAALLRGARAVVIPSLHEGFGFPALEAHAAEVPLVCSRAAALPEVAGDAALYFDPFDVEDIARALARVATDDALAAELVARGKRNLQRFSWQRCAEVALHALTQGQA